MKNTKPIVDFAGYTAHIVKIGPKPTDTLMAAFREIFPHVKFVTVGQKPAKKRRKNK